MLEVAVLEEVEDPRASRCVAARVDLRVSGRVVAWVFTGYRIVDEGETIPFGPEDGSDFAVEVFDWAAAGRILRVRDEHEVATKLLRLAEEKLLRLLLRETNQRETNQEETNQRGKVAAGPVHSRRPTMTGSLPPPLFCQESRSRQGPSDVLKKALDRSRGTK